MTVKELIETGVFEPVCEAGDTDREIGGLYCGDLLSLVMSRALKGTAWVTVMANRNTLAVASLTQVSCVILAEGTALKPEDVKQAEAQRVMVLRTEKPVFEAALSLYQRLHERKEVSNEQ